MDWEDFKAKRDKIARADSLELNDFPDISLTRGTTLGAENKKVIEQSINSLFDDEEDDVPDKVPKDDIYKVSHANKDILNAVKATVDFEDVMNTLKNRSKQLSNSPLKRSVKNPR